MREKIFLLFALLCTIVQGTRAQNYNVWDGTTTTQPSYSNHAIQINTAAEMAWLMNNYTAGSLYIPVSGELGHIWDNPRTMNISINADFDMTAANWARLIGYSENNTEHYGVAGGFCFPVTCNGNGHTIKIKIDGATDNYQGLFYGIGENATVKNLHVDADIHCAKSRLVGGICGENLGTIENCWVSGTVRSDWKEPSSAYTAKVGGIAGENNGTIQYCCVTANVQNDDADVGGIVGDNSGHTISHCTFYGTRTSAHTQDNDYAGDDGTEEYCYTTFNQGEYDAASGKDLYRRAIKYPYTCTVKTEGTGSIRTEAAGEYDVPGAQPSATFSLNVTSGSMHSYTVTDADGNNVPLQGHANDWSSFWFVMPKRDVTATVVFWGDWPKQGEGTEASPYLISSADDWNNFAQNVKLGRSYSGNYVKLTKDISVSKMAGGAFSGIFDGGGKTITANINGGDASTALFRSISGGTIKNLKVAGTISGGQHTAALLVGLGNSGDNLVEGCVVTATVNCSSSHMGGFLAHGNTSNVTIRGCVFNGKMTGGSTAKGIFYGWGDDGGTKSITNCLYLMADGQNTDGLDLTKMSGGTVTVSNCYKTTDALSQGTEAIFTSQAPSNIGSQTADYGMVKAYERGLLFDGKYYFAPSTSTGTGTEGDPYIISDAGQWDTFAANVNTGNNYSGKFLLLAADISVSTMMGASEANSFQGTFLGNNHTLTFTQGTAGSAFGQQNCAPFRFVKGATIRDLNVAGDIYTSQKFAAGLIAYSYGTTSVTNCHVATVIYSTVSGDGTHGGIIAMPGGTLSIEGCAYTGRLLTNKGTNNCGGFVAWHNSATISISNSLYAPGGNIPSGWSAINAGTTFVRDGSPTITNCYYTEPMGTAQATQAIAVATDDGLGDQVQAYSTLTIYQNGILCDGNYYKEAATLSGEGTEAEPYLINNEFEWRSFAAYVNNGNNFSGKYVKLTSDISVTTPVGYRVSDSDNKPFSGTFLGDGHTITVTLDNDGNQGLAPFRYINGATIKDLKVTGTIASSQYHTSGLVGFADGTNTIEDCLVTATLNISSDYAGGIIGHGLTSATTIRGCAFTGTVNGVDGNRSNIGGIWGWSDTATPTLENCLEAGTYNANIASMHPMGLQNGKGTITGCYYLNPQVGSPRNACTVSGAKQAYTAATAPANLGDLVQNYGMVKAYANGILYDGKYYVAPATISLANAADNSTTISNANGYVANVTLADRTLYKDGAWNTLCLPFSLNNFTGTPLEGATVKTLESTSFSDGTLTMNFSDDNVTSIKAGKPYIVKWDKADDYMDDDAHNIVNPVFNGVTISNVTANAETSYADFVGTYSPVSIYTAEKTNLYLGADNTLYYPTETGFKVNAFRGYFKLNGLTAGDITSGAIELNFGEDEATGIISIENGKLKIENDADAWYSLDGRKLSGKPTQRGIYINNGKKTIIK